MKANLIIFSLLCLVIIDNCKNFGKEPEKGNTNMRLNQFSKVSNNELEVITYIERRGAPNSWFGSSVAGIGDLNCDDYDDVIIGNYYKGAGEAYIFFGGANIDSIPDIILHGENDGDQFGSTVASGGDINSDGYPDFAVTAVQYTAQPKYWAKGRVYIYFGGAAVDTIPDVILDGENELDGFGIVAHGDVNNDHCDDLLISAPNANNANGKVYLFLGGSTVDHIPYWHTQKDSLNALMGINLAVGDINGDKKKDLIINNSPLINRQGNSHTVTEIYLSHDGFNSTASFSITDISGYSGNFQVLLCNDFNKDGYDDIIINMRDKTNIYYGGVEPDTIPDAYLEPWGLIYINRLANAGDVNGDGYTDILAGHYHPVYQTASVGLYLGSSKFNSMFDWTAGGGGYAISGAGDVNGDGYDDIAVGMTSSPYTTVAWGAIWILAGSPNLVDIGTGVEQMKQIASPETFNLMQNYPNPFNPVTTISYELAEDAQVSLVIFDLFGREIARIVNEKENAGIHSINWNAANPPSGVYFYRLRAGSFVATRKLVLLK